MNPRALFLSVLILFSALLSKAQDHTGAFISVWNLNLRQDGGSLFPFTLPSEGTYSYYWENKDNPSVNSGSYINTTGNLDLPALTAFQSGTFRIYIKGDYKGIYMKLSQNSAMALTAIESWGDIKWTRMYGAFQWCSNLNALPAAAPDLSRVTDMSNMFDGAIRFNQPVGHWNTSTITNMSNMFNWATAFNQDLSNWDVSNVTNMNNMFNMAYRFNQHLGNWQLRAAGVDLTGMLTAASGLSCENYGQTLMGWASNASTPNNVTLDAPVSTYAANAQPFRNALINKGWTITDNGGVTCSINTNAFISIWDTDKMDAGTTLQIPSTGTGYTYYWEKVGTNSNSQTFITNSGNLNIPAIAAKSGIYKLHIRGNYTAIKMGDNQNSAKALTTVESWGNIGWTTMNSAFRYCSNLTVLPSTAPNLGGVTNMGYTFSNCTLFNNAAVVNWNTATVTSMEYMFNGAAAFNQPIGSWNTGNVTNLSNMFADAGSFNQPIGTWNTGKVTNMLSVFRSAIVFNQNINSWNTINVTNLAGMFESATNFNQPIAGWNTANVTSMMVMFRGARAFNQPLAAWNTGKVTDMLGMFTNANLFNQDISSWNTVNVTRMESMFQNAIAFNRNLGAWQFKSGVTLTNMLSGSALNCQNYSLTLKGWSEKSIIPVNLTLGATNLKHASDAQVFKNKLITTKGWTITDAGAQAGCLLMNSFITVWDTDKMAAGTTLLIPSTGTGYSYYWEKIGTPGVNSVDYISNSGNLNITGIAAKSGIYKLHISGNYTAIYMEGAQNSAKALTAVETWGNIGFTTMASAFRYCSNLTGLPSAAPNLSGVTDMSFMFGECTSFNNAAVVNWNTSNITSMHALFFKCTGFNQNISSWNTSNVTSMRSMFSEAAAFNQPIAAWNTAKVTTMAFMFTSTNVFNQPIGSWSTANVNDMTNMFKSAVAFNQPLANWNTANVTNMDYMFNSATAFNQDIDSWNTGKVNSMEAMFHTATAFNKYIGSWKLKAGVILKNLLIGTGIDCSTYGLILKGWAGNTNTPNNITLGATGLKYAGDALSFRNTLVTTKGWTITDAGAETGCSLNQNVFITSWNTFLLMQAPQYVIPSTGTNYSYYWEKVSDPAVNSGGFVTTSGNLTLTGITNTTGAFKLYIKGPYTAIKMSENAALAKGLTAVENWGGMAWTSMSQAFSYCSNLATLPAAAPDLRLVTNMDGMFIDCVSLNAPIGNWNTEKVINMNSMLWGCSSFNAPIGNWNTGMVTDLSRMFMHAGAFNQPVHNWNTGNVIVMNDMFYNAFAFNQPVGNWNTAKVTNMSNMFNGAQNFNQPVGTWNIANVSNMSSIFQGATAFNQYLGTWSFKAAANLAAVFFQSGIDCENYGKSLKGWADNPGTPNNLRLGANGLRYAVNALPFRNALVAKGWVILDAGQSAGCNFTLPVQLVNYQAKLQGTTVLLSWQTSSEINNSHFTMERSIDGINFTQIGKIAANGNGDAPSSYRFTDLNPVKGKNYYRLAQVDIDGRSVQYGIKIIHLDREPSMLVNIYPNPATNEPVTITFTANAYNKASLLNAKGQVLASKKISPNQGKINFDMQQLKPGVYMIQLSGKYTTVEKLVKQ